MGLKCTALIEAEEVERAARALCRATYEELLEAKAQEPSAANRMAVCRISVAQAELRHDRALAQLWRARTNYHFGGAGVCA